MKVWTCCISLLILSNIWYEVLVHLRLKAQVHNCDHAMSVVRPSLTFQIFNFFSETTEWILTKLDRKQVLNVLYQVCVFRAHRSSKMAALASDWLKHFSTSSPQPLNGFWRNLTGSKSSTSSTKFVLLILIGHSRWPPWPLIGWNIFQLFLHNGGMDLDETWQAAIPQCPLLNSCFFVLIHLPKWPSWPLIG